MSYLSERTALVDLLPVCMSKHTMRHSRSVNKLTKK